MALTVAGVDKYSPRKTGIYDAIIEPWSGKGTTNRN